MVNYTNTPSQAFWGVLPPKAQAWKGLKHEIKAHPIYAALQYFQVPADVQAKYLARRARMGVRASEKGMGGRVSTFTHMSPTIGLGFHRKVVPPACNIKKRDVTMSVKRVPVRARAHCHRDGCDRYSTVDSRYLYSAVFHRCFSLRINSLSLGGVYSKTPVFLKKIKKGTIHV